MKNLKYYQTVKYDGIWLDMNEPTMIWFKDYKRGESFPAWQKKSGIAAFPGHT